MLGAITAVQYQWSGRVAAAEVQREKEHLDSAASLFASQFNEVVSQAAQFLRQNAWAAIERGEKLASTPELVGELYYLEDPAQGREGVRRLSATGFFTPVPRPDWLANSRCDGLVIEWPPAIIAGIQDPAAAERDRDTGTLVWRRPRPGQGGCFVARIDRAYLTATLFPQLLRQSFGETAVREYDFAVVIPDRPQDPLYGAPMSPDLRRRFFSALSTLPPGHSLVVRGSAGAFLKGQPAAALSRGIWDLEVAHKGAPLARAFRQKSRRVLLFSLGLELVLVAAIVFLVVGSRRMQRLADQKMRFVAGISHELRTPVASLAMLSRNLADGLAPGPDRVKQYGELIHQQTRRLNDMIEHTLQYAGVHSGLPLRVHEQIDMRSLVRESVEERRADLERSGIEVEMAIGEDLPAVSGDAKLLRTAVDNLIENAGRHAAAGRWIRVATVYSGAEKEVQVTVADRGAGIDPAEEREIFEPFSRGRAAMEAHVPGSGLGLSLVRSAAQAHHGAVTLVSEPGRGCTFTLHLPV
ncbi:MAG TPA: HAMP domain-containing sensor histidine kinase [Candidatus Limnocylindrales bacterium]|nr:HAMP domain-containing sensor histidine kinase [Candidatus Limnocylindrales bacterium]